MQVTTQHKIQTSHGRIAVETRGEGFPVVFIHGNSACREVFRKQISSPLLDGYHLISFDLPGHGASDDAPDSDRTYSRPGLADLVVELLGKMDIKRAAIVGASLGGHIAIEMLARSGISQGQFLIGTPAVGENFAEGFRGKPLNGLASRGELTSEEAQQFARAVFGNDFEPFMQIAIERTDRQFRSKLFAAAKQGAGVNQREMLNLTNTSTAIVNGENDQIINLDYVDSVPYANLWRGKCFRISKATHSAFWEVPHVVNLLLSDFLKELTGRRKT
ncbi:alpha/beta hydrolase [Rhodopseudomonas sp. P2A-2r]|uniref:alpha/beta fold hydrolase n=1 Tax=Rhodopseudomonas sp. P2A-2r TaxID=2991972 RepID=UPI002233F0EC|nr:alpha/beta hydrolase [Rhodopseudomonas sp. P2A-2r]UZE46717.1 alpha/beta hydrolase [Rhodopseudomonas sp. P2A-2r]